MHFGKTCLSGHYIYFVHEDESWFLANDSNVSLVQEEKAMHSHSYILLYKKMEDTSNKDE